MVILLKIAADLGGTNLRVGLFEVIKGELNLVRKKETEIEVDKGVAHSKKKFISTINDMFELAREEYSTEEDIDLGLCLAGPFKNGIYNPTNLRWGPTNISELVRRGFRDVPGVSGVGRIVARNDLETIGVYVANYGKGKGKSHVLVVAPGTGLGTALLIDGMPYEGNPKGGVSVEGGWITYKGETPEEVRFMEAELKKVEQREEKKRLRGLEEWVSGRGIVRCYKFVDGASRDLAGTRIEESRYDPAAISKEALDGDRGCIEAFELFSKHLAYGGLAPMSTLLNPEVIVLTGNIVQRNWRLMKNVVKRVYEANVLPENRSIPIVVDYEKNAGLKGAVILVTDQRYRKFAA